MKVVWTHSKFKKKEFTGTYQKLTLKNSNIGERVFILQSDPSGKNNSIIKISFESWQAALAMGWIRNGR